MKKIFLITGLVSLLGLNLRADTVAISESVANTVEVYLSTGVQISSAYVSPLTTQAVGNNLALRWGTFTGSFLPTLENSANWFANFVGVNGYVGLGSSGAGKMSGSMTGGDGNIISAASGNGVVTSNSGVSATGTIAAGSKLYAIIWNAPYVSNSNGGNTFYPTSDGTNGLQAAVLGNANWIMPTVTGLGTTATAFSLTTGTSAIIGALDLANKGVTLAVIPEPSSFSLVGLGMLALWGAGRNRIKQTK